ncbi:hypothetical protein [Bacillus subtilis]|uniref:hypothetical protein n=1 Tax=Bacillus subtilis TaxID=1423 RepID=UPI003EB9F9FB
MKKNTRWMLHVKQQQMAANCKYLHSQHSPAITKSIIDSHNGSIDVKSEIGRGTVFLIRLPAPDYLLDE